MTKGKKLGLILGISIPCGYVLTHTLMLILTYILMLILTLGLCFGLFFWALSRPFTYEGKYKDLYTTAVCNIFGVTGFIRAGEILPAPYIEIIEKDDYGRTLFLYQEYTDSKDTEPFFYGAVVIMQKSDSNKAYYYDDCYLPFYKPSQRGLNYKTIFSDFEIEDFKTKNNWNNELSQELLLSSDLVVRPPNGQLSLKDKDFEAPLKAYVLNTGYGGDDTIYRWSLYCQTDKNGLELYYARGIDRSVEPTKYYDFAVIFYPDKSCPLKNVLEIKDINHTDELLRQLKTEVGWTRYW